MWNDPKWCDQEDAARLYNRKGTVRDSIVETWWFGFWQLRDWWILPRVIKEVIVNLHKTENNQQLVAYVTGERIDDLSQQKGQMSTLVIGHQRNSSIVWWE